METCSVKGRGTCVVIELEAMCGSKEEGAVLTGQLEKAGWRRWGVSGLRDDGFMVSEDE